MTTKPDDATILAARAAAAGVVIRDEDQFKRRLAIGEDGDARRRTWKAIKAVKGTAGAAKIGAVAAQSAVVASVLAPAATSMNPLVWVGIMAPAAAVTPIGWVVAATLLAGGGYIGVSKLIASYSNKPSVDPRRVTLNAPIHELGIHLLDLNAALAFRVAAADGRIDRRERAAIRRHFVDEWGYAPAYLKVALPLIEADVLTGDATLDEVVRALATFHRASRDCAPEAMGQELVAFLQDIAAADGLDAPGERDALADIERTLAAANALTFERAAADLLDWVHTVGEAASSVGADAAKAAGTGLDRGLALARDSATAVQDGVASALDRERLASGANALRVAADRIAQNVSAATASAATTIGGVATDVVTSVGTGARKLSDRFSDRSRDP